MRGNDYIKWVIGTNGGKLKRKRRQGQKVDWADLVRVCPGMP
jgi:hypothetical protein